ncbi:hypothetical protein AHAS_Ahas20G0207500 [Arachis hypogaea]
MRYCPPPQNDSSHYPNGGWEYHQGMRQNDQSNFMGNFPPPQSNPRYYTHGGWEYQEHEMGYFPGPQNGPYFYECNHYSCCGWKDQNQRDFTHSYPIHQEPSHLNYPTSPSSFSYQNSSPLEFASTQFLPKSIQFNSSTIKLISLYTKLISKFTKFISQLTKLLPYSSQ